jgi:two-component system sensor histidine kinase UhpB
MIVLIMGAVIGTLVTRAMLMRSVQVGWIILVILLGVTVSMTFTCTLTRIALQPLYNLRKLVDDAKNSHLNIDTNRLGSSDPQLDAMVRNINEMIGELHAINQQNRMLSRHALQAQEDERKRIARTLHDETGQMLTMLIFHLERLEEQINGIDGAVRVKLAEMRQLAKQSLESLRRIVYGLRPTILDDLGLVAAVRSYARTHLESAGIKYEFICPSETLILSARLTTTLFRIIQEAINNIVRHSGANSVSITLLFTDHEVSLKIIDNGRGFLTDQDSTDWIRQGHWGLAGIQERVELVDGRLKIDSEPGKGTNIQVIIPIDAGRELR